MGSEKKRLNLLSDLKRLFIEANEGIDKNRLISDLCMRYGVMKSKANEYIQVLLDADFIIEDLGALWLKNGEKIDAEKEAEEILNRKIN